MAGSPAEATEQAVTVLVVDDHPIFVEAVRQSLASARDLQVVGVAGSGDEALVLAGRTEPDVVLLDLRMPGMDGLACLAELKRRRPDSRVIVLTARSDERGIRTALAAGADAYVVKTVGQRDLAPIIRQTVHRNVFTTGPPGFEPPRSAERPLTRRETTVLRAVAAGRTNAEVARELWVTEQTVKFHLRNVFRKLGVSSREEAVGRARAAGVLDARDDPS